MISISLDGLKEALEAFQEIIIPAKKKSAERRVKFENALKQAEIQKINAEILATEAKLKINLESGSAQADLARAQAQKARAEASLLEANLEKERHAMRLLYMDVAMQIVDRYSSPELSEVEKLNYVFSVFEILERGNLTSGNIKVQSLTSSIKDQR